MKRIDRYRGEHLSGISSRSMLKISELNKLVSIGGLTPEGWIGKMERLGSPLKVYRPADGIKRYRVGELIAKAKARGAELGPARCKAHKHNNAISHLEIQRGKARIDRHKLEVAELSRLLTARSLRQEQEIVKKAKSAESEMLCGVYFLVNGDRVVYVGQSTNVFNRVNAHLADSRKSFDSWCFIRCERKMLDVLESLYIHFLQPAQQGKIGNTEQLSTPLTLDELFSRLSVRRTA